jgi:hypothetical protein
MIAGLRLRRQGPRGAGRTGSYTGCMPDAGLTDACSRCGQVFQYALNRCPSCHKSVCEECVHRMGGSAFCSTECAHAFFFGGEEEIAEAEAERYEEGE